jgi:hypothetical protein
MKFAYYREQFMNYKKVLNSNAYGVHSYNRVEQSNTSCCRLVIQYIVVFSERKIKTFPNIHPNHLQYSFVYYLKRLIKRSPYYNLGKT